MAEEREFGRLKPEAVAEFTQHGWPPTRPLFRWMRGGTNPTRISEHWYIDHLKEGKEAPWELIKAVAEYCRKEMGRETSAAGIAVKASAPAKPRLESPEGFRENPWRWGWAKLYSYLREPFQLAEEAYCNNHRDIDLAARMGLECVGRMHAEGDGTTLSDADALALGEKVMDRTRKEYAGWLFALWQEDPYTILFHVLGGRGGGGQGGERVGVMGSVPLKKAAYLRYREGRMEDSEFRREDFEAPSEYVYLHMLSEPRVTTRRGAKRLALVQLNTMNFQLAIILKTLTRKGKCPSFLAIAGTESNEQKMSSYGFINTGKVTPRSKKRLYELVSVEELPPDAPHGSIYQRVQYDMMWSVLRFYQAVFTKERRALERDP